MTKRLPIIQIGRWAIGLHRRTGQAVLRLEFSDREPMMLAVPIAEGKKIAQSLLAIDQPKQPTSRQQLN